MKTRSLYLYWFWNGTGSWWMDKWTDRITMALASTNLILTQ